MNKSKRKSYHTKYDEKYEKYHKYEGHIKYDEINERYPSKQPHKYSRSHSYATINNVSVGNSKEGTSRIGNTHLTVG